MIQLTKIQWANATINFWMGCSKVSPGCKFCYMHRIIDGDGKDPSIVRKVSISTIAWKLRVLNEPALIFTCSMSDFFIEDADKWRDWAWDIIRKHPQHQWQILTKRPERILQCLPPDWGEGWDNVWLGVSIENEDYFYRAEILSKIPAKIRFISAEPLLDELDLLQLKSGRRIIDDFHWVIIGGESGNDIGKYLYRECKVEWMMKIIADIKNHAPHVAVFNKQLGTHLAKQMKLKDKHGGNWDQWPTELKVREFPKGIEYAG